MHQDRLADALGNLGSCAAHLGKSEESEQVQRRSLEIMEKLAAELSRSTRLSKSRRRRLE